MQPSGLNWKWPSPDDILWYDEKDIVQKIEEPKIVNKRGVYCVNEITLKKNYSETTFS